MCQENTTWHVGGQVSGRYMLYEAQFANETDVYDYDFGSAPAIQTTTANGKTWFVYPGAVPANAARWGRTDLYPVSITAAYGSTVAQVRQYYYDCATGALNHEVFATNSNTRTSYSYDPYARVTQEVVGAEQSEAARKRVTTTEYEDQNRRVRVVVDGKLGTVYHFNQLGELYLQRENADSAIDPVSLSGMEGIRTVMVERTASGAHYVLRSNPHLPPASDGEPAMGWTLERFDQAGRVQQVSYYRGAAKPAPFGANTGVTGSLTYSYNGATTTVTDSAGTSRTTMADALGRTQSASDGASSASYVYDALDNLTTVTQTDSFTYGSAKTQTRSFGYSSLGRLITASNPEADSPTGYTYFANGALKTKTDARGVTATITIDALNRVVKKDYSATTPATPNARFCYDGKRYNAGTDTCVSQSRSDYPVGSLTHAAARRGDGTVLSQTEYTDIDPLGRVLASRQTTDGLTGKTLAYQYAAGGALTAVQYASGNWVTYEVNGANRVSAVRKGQGGSSYYVQKVLYKPTGALASATVGLEAANQWTEVRDYNSRLQARKLRVVKGGQKLLGLDWIYSAGSQYNAGQDMYEETGSDNNGNLRLEKLAHTVGSAFSVDRSYGATPRRGGREPRRPGGFAGRL